VIDPHSKCRSWTRPLHEWYCAVELAGPGRTLRSWSSTGVPVTYASGPNAAIQRFSTASSITCPSAAHREPSVLIGCPATKVGSGRPSL
jgi:hypothetical protein